MMRCAHRIPPRLAALLAAALLGLCATAAQAAQLSPSVVLVLKLVAADRVQPVTGIVVSNDGLVLVPAAFAAEQAEIIVLDGGTDIIAHGRHAEVVARNPETGLALLAAEGLWRTGITLSDSMPDEGRELILQAYPPARNIAAGDGPLLIPAYMDGGNAVDAASGSPLPNVTGALLDACGHLVALHVADDAQSLAPAPTADLVGLDNLVTTIGAMHPDVPRAGCTLQPGTMESQAQATAEQLPEAEQAGAAKPVRSGVESPPEEQPTPVTPGTPVTVEAAEQSAPGAPEQEQAAESPAAPEPAATPPWLLPVALLALVLLAWGFTVARRNRSNARKGHVQPASDEPDTVRLVAAGSAVEPVMRSRRGGAEGLPDPGDLPAGCNGLVVIEPRTDSAPATRAFCAVDLESFEAVAGRGGADLEIAHPSVSRRHARIVGRNGVLSIEDLGSSNGTHIDRVPCLPGEVVRLDAGTELWLGEFHCSVTLLDKERMTPCAK
jgi:hypothetical protein